MDSDFVLTLNIDELSFIDNYSLIEDIKRKPFPPIPGMSTMPDYNVDLYSTKSALDFFIAMIKKYDTAFILNETIGNRVADGEYRKLTKFIDDILLEISTREQNRDLTWLTLTTKGDPKIEYDGTFYKFGGKNLIQTKKLLETIKKYIQFQYEKKYPLPSDISIRDDREKIPPSVTFYLQSEVKVDTPSDTTTMTPTVVDEAELDTFDEFIDDIIYNLTENENDIYVHKKLSRITDYSIPTLSYKTAPLFKCEGEKLTTFHTASVSNKNKKYYIPVHNNAENEKDSRHQFDISFGHINGSGSSHIENEVDILPSKTMYRKYLVECFGRNTGKFTFKNNKNGDYFYAIQIDRELFKDRLDQGNFELCLAPLSSSVNQLYNTGSNFKLDQSSSTFFTLIDDSDDTTEIVTNREGLKDYYYITSGSLRDGIYGEPEDDAWGVVFPKMGLIVLDGVVLDQSCSFNTVTASIDGDNIRKLFVSISGSSTPTLFRTETGSFFARSVEESLISTYFCRAYYNEFNYSTNYTYMMGNLGEIKNLYFRENPNSYITSIGLYNKNNDLVAIGKLPQPLLKNEGTEYIFQVKLRLN